MIEAAKPKEERALLPAREVERATRSRGTVRGLKVALGPDTLGQLAYLDLADPNTCHCLVAGTTGSGKTTLLHWLLWQLAMNNRPESLWPFQNVKDRDLVESSSASFAFASAPKVGFIQFDLPGHQFFCISAVSNNGQSDERHGFEDRRITQPDLGSNLSGRPFQFKAFDDPQPLFRGNSQFIDPTATEVMKRIPTTFAAEPFTNNPVDLISVASDAETTVVFPTCFDKEQPSAILAPEKGFKAV